VLCRRTSAPPASRSKAPPAEAEAPASSGRIWLLVAVALALAAAGWFIVREPSDDAGNSTTAAQLGAAPSGGPEASRPEEGGAEVAPSQDVAAGAILEGTLRTKNRSDRSGAYLIPGGANLPLLVALHGSGGNGAGLVAELRASALRRKFAIVAPDSGFIAEAGTYTWYVARERSDPSADSPHISATIDEVLALAGGRIAPVGWLVVGHSGGASSAPYLATHDARFVAFGVLHGGAFPGAFGPLRPRGWFSTGSADPARTPVHVSAEAQAAERVLGSGGVEMHVFQGGHALLPEEIEGVLRFWLDRGAQ